LDVIENIWFYVRNRSSKWQLLKVEESGSSSMSWNFYCTLCYKNV